VLLYAASSLVGLSTVHRLCDEQRAISPSTRMHLMVHLEAYLCSMLTVSFWGADFERELTLYLGVAYIGLTAPENASVVSNVTFSESGSDSSAWVINSAPAATNITGLDFSIDPASDAFNSVQFTNSNSSSLTTSGFMFYGTLVFWVSSSGDWLSLFYATETGQDNLWTLKWNSNQTSDDGSIPVTLNTQAPGNLASVGKALQAL